MKVESKIRILFVCTGNLCRSPMAQGIFAKLVAEQYIQDCIEVDSAGTHAFYRADEPPEPHAIKAALKRGIDLSGLRARPLKLEDFIKFDYILAMDRQNYQHLRFLCPPGQGHKLKLFMSYAPQWKTMEVPDPYGSNDRAFEQVLDMIEAGAAGLLEVVQKESLGSNRDSPKGWPFTDPFNGPGK